MADTALANAPVSETAVEMIGVNKWFGEFHVLRDVNLSVARGEKLVLCGPSGSGKSTLIRCLNRLESHQTGKIVVDGVELTDDVKAIDEVRREVGMVFQQFNLFPPLHRARQRGRRPDDRQGHEAGRRRGAGARLARQGWPRRSRQRPAQPSSPAGRSSVSPSPACS